MKRYVLLFILAYFPVYAEETGFSYPEDVIPAEIIDWNSLNAALLKRGTNLPGVNWVTINQLCGNGWNMEPKEYSHCQYRLVVRSELFASDREACAEEARIAYPDSLLRRERVIRRYLEADATGIRQQVEEIMPPYTRREVNDLRMRPLAECMYNYGWRSANRWQEGRR